MEENNRDFIFISAQPDVPYFHWQCEVYINNFIRMGIEKERIFVLFSFTSESDKLSEGAEKLRKLTPNILGYKDDRNRKHYIPSIKPYLIYRFLEENPERGKIFFLHDSDIIFNYLPNFHELTKDQIQYMSDTNSYLNFDYIMDCDSRYRKTHQQLESGMLLREMIDVVGVEPSDVKKNSKNSGGAQYLLKNQTWFVWYKIYKDSTLLYDKMKRFHSRYPIPNGEIQFWTAEMWSILWNLWWWGFTTKVTDVLKFCWATDPISYCETHPILHMAGITEDMKHQHFYKGEFIDSNPINIMGENKDKFNYVIKTSSTNKYLMEIKKLLQKSNFDYL